MLKRQGVVPSERAFHNSNVASEVQRSDESTVSRIKTSILPVVVQPISRGKLRLVQRNVHNASSIPRVWQRGCRKFVPVLGGDGTKIAPQGDLFDQPPGEMS